MVEKNARVYAPAFFLLKTCHVTVWFIHGHCDAETFLHIPDCNDFGHIHFKFCQNIKILSNILKIGKKWNEFFRVCR